MLLFCMLLLILVCSIFYVLLCLFFRVSFAFTFPRGTRQALLASSQQTFSRTWDLDVTVSGHFSKPVAKLSSSLATTRSAPHRTRCLIQWEQPLRLHLIQWELRLWSLQTSSVGLFPRPHRCLARCGLLSSGR